MKNTQSMTAAAAARIQSATAKANSGVVPKGSFAARAQAAAAPKTTPSQQPNWPSKVPGEKSGGGRDNAPPKK
ncbi:hypothetical protein EKO29_09675 [Colwellia sp. Arc7-635]|jgi:hypothetical protein|uniref:hypothetical protein n=1 Tax=Colwellia sp. Arc7-635 TaxID=2497879 RepID=UPI000F8520D4|nr:hypothetical protein [Colwellia sp. Arc7-635]AZQ84265.1 hypothetical protein EKO29_09675 [Colwellia sp. Arc7-635]